jgi:hypothetical protein
MEVLSAISDDLDCYIAFLVALTTSINALTLEP